MMDIIGPLLVLGIASCFIAAFVWLARLISGKTRYTYRQTYSHAPRNGGGQ